MNIYFPISHFDEESKPMIVNLTKVIPIHKIPHQRKEQLESYYNSIQDVIRKMIPEECEDIITKHQFKPEVCKRLFYKGITERTPLIKGEFYENDERTTLSITTLCKAKYTQEVGRFICDYFSKWLIPGKLMELSHVHSSEIQFEQFQKHSFFFFEMFIEIENKNHLESIKANLSDLIDELKLNILTVYHARRVLSVKTLTEEQKKIIIQENISELLDIPSKGYNHNLFEQMQHFLLKASSEEKILRIKDSLSPLIDLKPQIFERDLFNEIQKFILPAKKEFTLIRKLSYVTRIIAYSYLLRKRASFAFNSNPSSRFAVTKLLRTNLILENEIKPVLGILVGINYSSENEIFDERHLLAAIYSIIPDAKPVKDSTIHNKREYTGTRILYLEIEKMNDSFSSEEIKKLQVNLTQKVLSKIESVTNTVFMPRNEEEILRNILTLSNQLQFPTDLPQVMINYHSQQKSLLVFTVILVRIEYPNLKKIKKSKSSNEAVFIREKEEKQVGVIRKEYKKKAYILEICCQKKDYLRTDFSIDLNKARRDVFSFITSIGGDVRDFNGGMIAKQNEVLIELKRNLLQSNFTDLYILENFFYSFIPRFMQCILPVTALKHSFSFLLEALEHDFNQTIYFIKTITWEKYFIISVATINQSFKEFIEERISNLNFDSSSLATSYTNIHDIPILSYILNFSDPLQSEALLKTLVEGIKEWKNKLS
ncbi:MAG: hypothetical protein S4CHLAM20_08720 [Chlamydiia bacterium]|nr:hypothetical protein [Chlamydiia bacterium]